MATLETRARCESDPDLNLLLTNSTLEQPLWRSLFQNLTTSSLRRSCAAGPDFHAASG